MRADTRFRRAQLCEKAIARVTKKRWKITKKKKEKKIIIRNVRVKSESSSRKAENVRKARQFFGTGSDPFIIPTHRKSFFLFFLLLSAKREPWRWILKAILKKPDAWCIAKWEFPEDTYVHTCDSRDWCFPEQVAYVDIEYNVQSSNYTKRKHSVRFRIRLVYSKCRLSYHIIHISPLWYLVTVLRDVLTLVIISPFRCYVIIFHIFKNTHMSEIQTLCALFWVFWTYYIFIKSNS